MYVYLYLFIYVVPPELSTSGGVDPVYYAHDPLPLT